MGYHAWPCTGERHDDQAQHCTCRPSGKGADTDLLREMITRIVERVMQFDVENLCAAG